MSRIAEVTGAGGRGNGGKEEISNLRFSNLQIMGISMQQLRKLQKQLLTMPRFGLLDWIKLLWRAGWDSFSRETSLLSAAISYYALFSLFPLTLLTVAIASLWLDPLAAESEIVSQLEFAAPGLGVLLGENLQRIVSSRGPITGTAVLMLLWSASNIFGVLTNAMDKLWGVEYGRSVWRHRGLAMGLVLIISSLLLVASTVSDTVVTILNVITLPGEELIRFWMTQLLYLLLDVVLFGLLYYYLPHIKLRWRDVAPGAVAGGLLWEGAKYFFLDFVTGYLNRSNLVYGSLAAITAFLTWTYFSGLIFVFGARVNIGYKEMREGVKRVDD